MSSILKTTLDQNGLSFTGNQNTTVISASNHNAEFNDITVNGTFAPSSVSASSVSANTLTDNTFSVSSGSFTGVVDISTNSITC